jgi:hypothetical protein
MEHRRPRRAPRLEAPLTLADKAELVAVSSPTSM